MQKKKMVTTLLVAGMILANSLSGLPNLANAQVMSTASSKKPAVSVKKTTKKYATSAIAAKKKAKVTKKKKKRRSTVSRSRGGNPQRASKVVEFAKAQLGKPYVWGASGPNAFDCSGFTSYVYSNFGISLPHNSTAQSNYGTKVSRADLQPGDLLFFATGGSKSINHVAIYIGNDSFIHGSSGRSQVYISDLSDYTKYAGVLITAKRVL